MKYITNAFLLILFCIVFGRNKHKWKNITPGYNKQTNHCSKIFCENDHFSAVLFHYFSGLEGNISFQKRFEMPFTSAFIEEVLRFRTLTPLGGVQHCTSEDAKLEGYVIPKGVMVRTSDKCTFKICYR